MIKKTATPWKTKNWHVSSWNYLEEVTKGFKPPKKVRIHDVTLRDGEQMQMQATLKQTFWKMSILQTLQFNLLTAERSG